MTSNDYKNIIDWAKELLKDGNSEIISVITCQSLPNIVKNAPEDGKFDKKLFELANYCLDEKKDLIKEHMVEVLIALRKISKGYGEELLKNIFDQKEWRVKFMIYKNIAKLGEILGKPVLRP